MTILEEFFNVKVWLGSRTVRKCVATMKSCRQWVFEDGALGRSLLRVARPDAVTVRCIGGWKGMP